jgi:hypothetical protein
MAGKPTHEQAQLQLQVYDLRREERLRKARDWFFKNFFVQNLDDFMKVAAPGTEGGTFVGMIFGYWEQTCALLNYGLLHEDLFFETNGEFFGIWERLKAIVPEAREKWAYKGFLAHMEQAAKRYEEWMGARSPNHIGVMREFMKQMQTQMSKAAA